MGTMECWNPTTRAWETLTTQLPIPLYDAFSFQTVLGYTCVGGGRTTGAQENLHIWCWNETTFQWTPSINLVETRSAASVLYYKENILLVGGGSTLGSQTSCDIIKADSSPDAFILIQQTLVGSIVQNAGTVNYNGTPCVVGGAGAYPTRSLCYDGVEFVPGPALTAPRVMPISFPLMNGGGCVAGGYTNATTLALTMDCASLPPYPFNFTQSPLRLVNGALPGANFSIDGLSCLSLDSGAVWCLDESVDAIVHGYNPGEWIAYPPLSTFRQAPISLTFPSCTWNQTQQIPFNCNCFVTLDCYLACTCTTLPVSAGGTYYQRQASVSTLALPSCTSGNVRFVQYRPVCAEDFPCLVLGPHLTPNASCSCNTGKLICNCTYFSQSSPGCLPSTPMTLPDTCPTGYLTVNPAPACVDTGRHAFDFEFAQVGCFNADPTGFVLAFKSPELISPSLCGGVAKDQGKPFFAIGGAGGCYIGTSLKTLNPTDSCPSIGKWAAYQIIRFPGCSIDLDDSSGVWNCALENTVGCVIRCVNNTNPFQTVLTDASQCVSIVADASGVSCSRIQTAYYGGCYHNNLSLTVQPMYELLSVDACMRTIQTSQTMAPPYFGIANGQCLLIYQSHLNALLGQTITISPTSQVCNDQCIGGVSYSDQGCGGNGTISIYGVVGANSPLPTTSLNCFNDQPSITATAYEPQQMLTYMMTPNVCALLAKARGKPVFGLRGDGECVLFDNSSVASKLGAPPLTLSACAACQSKNAVWQCGGPNTITLYSFDNSCALSLLQGPGVNMALSANPVGSRCPYILPNGRSCTPTCISGFSTLVSIPTLQCMNGSTAMSEPTWTIPSFDTPPLCFENPSPVSFAFEVRQYPIKVFPPQFNTTNYLSTWASGLNLCNNTIPSGMYMLPNCSYIQPPANINSMAFGVAQRLGYRLKTTVNVITPAIYTFTWGVTVSDAVFMLIDGVVVSEYAATVFRGALDFSPPPVQAYLNYLGTGQHVFEAYGFGSNAPFPQLAVITIEPAYATNIGWVSSGCFGSIPHSSVPFPGPASPLANSPYMTPGICAGLAKQMNYSYFAITNQVECWGGNGDDSPSAPVPLLSTLCNLPCYNTNTSNYDSSYMCGGAGQWSIYAFQPYSGVMVKQDQALNANCTNCHWFSGKVYCTCPRWSNYEVSIDPLTCFRGAITVNSNGALVCSLPDPSPDIAYAGCHPVGGFQVQLATGLDPVTVDGCAVASRLAGYHFFGIRAGTECWAGNMSQVLKMANQTTSISYCKPTSFDCAGGTTSRERSCGDVTYLSIYGDVTLFPVARPLGCFSDLTSHIGVYTVDERMTATSCAMHALATGYTAFGLQYGKVCYLFGDMNKATHLGPATCNIVCQGRATTTTPSNCGGNYANTIYSLAGHCSLLKLAALGMNASGSYSLDPGQVKTATCQNGWTKRNETTIQQLQCGSLGPGLTYLDGNESSGWLGDTRPPICVPGNFVSMNYALKIASWNPGPINNMTYHNIAGSTKCSSSVPTGYWFFPNCIYSLSSVPTGSFPFPVNISTYIVGTINVPKSAYYTFRCGTDADGGALEVDGALQSSSWTPLWWGGTWSGLPTYNYLQTLIYLPMGDHNFTAYTFKGGLSSRPEMLAIFENDATVAPTQSPIPPSTYSPSAAPTAAPITFAPSSPPTLAPSASPTSAPPVDLTLVVWPNTLYPGSWVALSWRGSSSTTPAQWNLSNPTNSSLNRLLTGNNIQLPPFSLPVGTYSIVLNVLGASGTPSTAVHSLTVVPYPFTVRISKGTSAAACAGDSLSAVWDTPSGVSLGNIAFLWSGVCLGSSATTGLSVTVDQPASGYSCMVSVSAWPQGNPTPSTASIVLDFSGAAGQVCGVSISGPAMVNPGAVPRLFANTRTDSSVVLSYAWTASQQVSSSLYTTVPSTCFQSGTTSRSLAMLSTCLVEGITYNFSVAISAGSAPSVASTSFGVRYRPTNGTCAMNQPDPTVARFVATCTDWVVLSSSSPSFFYSLSSTLADSTATPLVISQAQSSPQFAFSLLPGYQALTFGIATVEGAITNFNLNFNATGRCATDVNLQSIADASLAVYCNASQSTITTLQASLNSTLQQDFVSPELVPVIGQAIVALVTLAPLESRDQNFYGNVSDFVSQISDLAQAGSLDLGVSLNQAIAPLLSTAPCSSVNSLLPSLASLSTKSVANTIPGQSGSINTNFSTFTSSSQYLGDSGSLQTGTLSVSIPSTTISNSLTSTDMTLLNGISSLSATSYSDDLTRCREQQLASSPAASSTAHMLTPVTDVLLTNENGLTVKVSGQPVTLTFTVSRPECGRPACAWWDPVAAGWTQAGCDGLRADNSHFVCQCSHLTEFSLLLVECATKAERSGYIFMVAAYSLLGAVTLAKLCYKIGLDLRTIHGVKLGRHGTGIQMANRHNRGNSDNDSDTSKTRSANNTSVSVKLKKLTWQTPHTQHLLTILACILRALSCATLGQLFLNDVFEARAALLLAPYLLVFWIYTLLVFNWAAVYHFGMRKSAAGDRAIRILFGITNVGIVIIVITLLIELISASPSQSVVVALAILLVVLTALTAGGFLIYSTLLYRGLHIATGTGNKQRCTLGMKLLAFGVAASAMLVLQSCLQVIAASQSGSTRYAGHTPHLILLTSDIGLLIAVLAVYHKYMSESE